MGACFSDRSEGPLWVKGGFRRIATRYDKLAVNYLAFVTLASIRLWPRVYESTPWCVGVIELIGKRVDSALARRECGG